MTERIALNRAVTLNATEKAVELHFSTTSPRLLLVLTLSPEEARDLGAKLMQASDHCQKVMKFRGDI